MATKNRTPDLAEVRNLLDYKRRIAIQNWTAISELRLRELLPAWLLRSFPDAGLGRELSEIRAAQYRTDAALHGERVKARYALGQVIDNGSGEYVLHEYDTGHDVVGNASAIAARNEVTEALTPRQLSMLARGVVADARGAA